MIFKDGLCNKVLSGEKTQTRRVKKETEYFVGGAFGSYDRVKIKSQNPYRMNPIKWMIGRTYAVQPGRGKKAVGRIKLLSIREEHLRDIVWQDVMAEGVDLTGLVSRGRNRNTDAGHRFAHLWNSINKKPGARWEDNPTVWVLAFQST